MRLSDIMGQAGLTMFPEIGLIIFLAVFAAIVWRICVRIQAVDLDVHGRLPLNDLHTSVTCSNQRGTHETP